jgi:hypothetical protein
MSGRSSENVSKRGPKTKREAQPYVFGDRDALEYLLDIIVGTAMSGGAIRVGLTRDLGALAIGIYKDGDYGTEYIRPTDDLSDELRSLVVGWLLPVAYWDDDAGQYRQS